MGSVAGLSKKPRPASLKKIVDKLLAGVADKNEEQRDISCLGKLQVASHQLNMQPSNQSWRTCQWTHSSWHPMLKASTSRSWLF